MVINNKKGYLRTLEAVIAVVLLMIFVFSSISLKEPKTKNIPVEIELIQNKILSEVQSNNGLRSNLINDEEGLILIYLETNIVQKNIDFAFDICFDILIDCEVRSDTFPGDDIYVDSLIIYEGGGAVIFRLYLLYDTF